jgi:S-adenosylmethionine hydrolase
VGPDNGLMAPAATEAGIRRIVELDPSRYRPKAPVSTTFHGRDVFAPAAAYLWNGKRLASLGRPITAIERMHIAEPVESARSLIGRIIYIDGYGNLITNIRRSDLERLAARFPGIDLLVKIPKGAAIELFNTYADVPTGAPLATIGSFELMEIAVRERNAAARYSLGLGATVKVVLKR